MILIANQLPASAQRGKQLRLRKSFKIKLIVFFTGNSRPPTREYTGSELKNWKYWENIKTGQIIMDSLVQEYLEGVTIEPVTKPYALGMPGSLEVGVFKGTNVVPLCYVSGLSDELKK